MPSNHKATDKLKLRDKRKHFLVYGAPAIGEDEIEEVVRTMRSGWLGTGPRVAQFEEEFSRYCGAVHAAAVNSCTAALHLSVRACGLRAGDEVITTPLTFCATANAIIHAGCVPILVDVDPETMNLDPEKIEAAITPNTKAIVAVHFAGRPCEMDALLDICDRRNLFLIEDCAHAIETMYRGRHVGTFGDFGCFSFYVTKNIVTGEGGMVLSKHQDSIDQIKISALHGMTKDAWKRFGDEGFKHYLVIEAGFKYNMMDIQAAIGIHQLRRVEQNWLRRSAIWKQYNDAFKDLPVGKPAEVRSDTRHAYHLYTLMIDSKIRGILNRDQFLDAMQRENIGTGVHYLSLPEHPFYQEAYGWRPEDYPNAMKIGRETVSLPLSANLTDHDVGDVISAVRRVLGFTK